MGLRLNPRAGNYLVVLCKVTAENREMGQVGQTLRQFVSTGVQRDLEVIGFMVKLMRLQV
jgi:hypothetical protein